MLISGPNGSSVQVQGQSDIPVVTIGSAYSFAAGSSGYDVLQNEVYTWTGKRLRILQSGGPATQFIVY